MLEFQNVSFEVNNCKKDILNNFSFVFPDSGVVLITGPNGSGKSTLAKLVMGVIKPTAGKILFNGKDISKIDITKRSNLGISFAFQQPIELKGITVYELIDIALGSGSDPELVKSYIKTVGLDPDVYLKRELSGNLSGGERKRIEIASVLARNAKLSIFDEPEAGIDLWSFNDLKNVFKKLKKDNPDHLIIIISHQERLFEIADQVLLLSDGKIVCKGTPEEVLPKLGAKK